MAARLSVNLGLFERTAIVCASIAGLGRAGAEALLAEGVRVAVNGPDTARTDDRTSALAAPQARCLTSNQTRWTLR